MGDIKKLRNPLCPIARSLEHVGDWWSMLILRDAMLGSTRFDEFEKSLGIAPNMLTRRLTSLVESGLLQRRRYSEKPPRDEYLLTDCGRDFAPILMAMLAWGNKHFAPEGIASVVVDRATGKRVEPVVTDRKTGQELTIDTVRLGLGPAASESMRKRYEQHKEPPRS
jgi:DNA-binding HxlR family transcriptional regulator